MRGAWEGADQREEKEVEQSDAKQNYKQYPNCTSKLTSAFALYRSAYHESEHDQIHMHASGKTVA